MTLVCPIPGLGQTSLWQEGFETDDFWDRWHVDGGVWAVGAPSSGPNKAFAGLRCAGTVLDGNYPAGADARLVRDKVFTVPAATEHPRLRFWHWFQAGPGASRSVEIKVGAGGWQPITAASGWANNGDWSRAFFDLSPFSGQPVTIAFHFQSSADPQVGPGWYVDDVVVETGAVGSDLTRNPESFEQGLGNWTVDHGVWQVGQPTQGPARAAEGLKCVGTVLTNAYPWRADSRLISPEFVVPAAADSPRLRYWHWYSIWPGDTAQVEISVGGGGWQPISGVFANNSVVWVRSSADLTAYAGQSVQIAFHFQSNGDENIALGWYIDQVVVETGPLDWDPVHQPEGFESGLGNWTIDTGTWEVGTSTYGPRGAFHGTNCAGTVLTSVYAPTTDSRLISPPFVVPAVSERPRLRFWHWLRNQPGDPATVEIRVVNGDWVALSPPMVAPDGTWARPLFGLDAYAGQRVQLAFHFQSNNDSLVAPGWYIDDVTVETGPAGLDIVNHPEGFESGLNGWAVDNGTWEVGRPDTWPETAYAGANCAGTVLLGNYTSGVDSRLISPEFEIPAGSNDPRLRFWHWFSTYPGDYGVVEISLAGGPWQPISRRYEGGGPVWTRAWCDLRPYAGQLARIAFHFLSDEDLNIARGWYIDEVVVETGAFALAGFNQSEGFESGLGNWSVDNGTWETGQPGSGPGFAYKGTNCAATVLWFAGGNYPPNTDSRLVSPELVVPCIESGPRLRFAHWYDIAAGDQGTVQVRLASGGDWETILGPITGASHDWITGFYDLAPYAGKTIQIAFRFQSNDDSQVSSGWYLDEIRIQATLFPTFDQVSTVEGTLFTSTFGSSCQNLRYVLGDDAPAGMQIDSALGIVAWVPTEDQGPGVYTFHVCAEDVSAPQVPLDCASMEVTVVENNTAPTIDPIESKTIQGGEPLRFTATAFDQDRPVQTLTFSLDDGAPFGATIDPLTGEFNWTPTPTQATTQYTITVRVTDNGTPPKSASTSFGAAPAGPVTAISLEVTRLSAQVISVCMRGGTLGAIYALETTTDLKVGPNTTWTELQRIWKGDQNFCETTVSTVNSARYYRINRVQ